jgi:glycerophosphoryl diester phosphodiesterase
MDTIKIEKKQVRMIAHRGLSGLEKENTCSAFVAAGNRASYFGIETDVHRTADGRFIIFHDDNTKRVGLDSMVIEETTFDTLRNLQLTDIDGVRGRKDLILPTLEEYIGICKKYGKDCVLELKNQFRAADVYKIVSIIDKLGYLDHVIFISFALKNLLYLRRRYPTQRAQYLLSTYPEGTTDLLKKNQLGLDIKYTALTKEIVDAVHAAGQEVNCWTVNTAEDGNAMVALGVDYITSNILEGV